LFHKAGIDSSPVVRSQGHGQARIRAGVLAPPICWTPLAYEHVPRRLVHGGFALGSPALRRWQSPVIDSAGTEWQQVMVYGWSKPEVTKDLMDARAAAGLATV
jgi:hypothetical protein